MEAKGRSSRSSNRRYRARTGGLTITVLLALLVLAAAPASAKKTHLLLETFGSAAKPSLTTAGSLAVDRSTGDLLVIDTQAKTVSRYHPDGTPDSFSALGTNVIDAKGTGNCATVPADCDQTPQNGFAFSNFGYESQVAVDNSGTATDGNIYVTQISQAAGNLVDIFAGDGKYLGQLTAAGTTKFGTIGHAPFSPCGVAVDGNGNLFVGGGYDNRVYKFDPSANPPVNTDNVASFPTNGEPVCNLAAGTQSSAGLVFAGGYVVPNGVLKLDGTSGQLGYLDPGSEDLLVTVDPQTGHLYAFGNRATGTGIAEFDLSAPTAPISTFNTPAIVTRGIAVDGVSGRIYVSSENTINVYGPTVTIPDVTTNSATITGDTSAKVNGTVNPDGLILEECFFEYGTTTAYGQTKPCAESLAEIGVGTKAVHADLSGLAAETLYHYRLVAKNVNATIQGSDQAFKTPSKPAINGQWAMDVGLAEASLKAKINPENSATTYRFEWGLDSSYGQSTAETVVGSDNTDHTVSLGLAGLQPGTTYHYRVVASNGIGVTEGADHEFITFLPALQPKADCPNQGFRSGGAARMPDCRAYEMVSPVDKNNGDIEVLGREQTPRYPTGLEQGSSDGERITYSSVTAFGDSVSAPWTSQYIATRKAGQAWLTHAISPPRQAKSISANPAVKFDLEYKAFSADLCNAWLQHDTDPLLAPGAVEGFVNVYRRGNCGGGADSYEAVTTVQPPPPALAATYFSGLQGFSANGVHAFFVSPSKLTGDAGSGGNSQIYEATGGALNYVCRLPNGTTSGLACSLGTENTFDIAGGREASVARAVSEDGSRVFWSSYAANSNLGKLYLRLNPDQEQSALQGASECTEPEKACTIAISESPARFWTAATDGSVAIYSVGGKLFEFDVETATSQPIAEGLEGVAGASDDASRVYFSSTKALNEEPNSEGDKAKEGQANLYLYEWEEGGGSFAFIATLSSEDDGTLNPVASIPTVRASRVSPDGGTLAFTSSGSPTGYDNVDANSGKADTEVYLYAAGTDKLACISCNPSGARPEGRNFAIGGTPQNVWAAAHISPWETQFFAPRALSEDGSRLFFESFEALVPRDTNGVQDVYEWERAGSSEECANEKGAESYVASAGGCLSLVSSGQSPTDSEFADASPDGRDVFFKTAASLLSQDPGLVDIYDARAGGGLPPPPAPTPPCEGEACQSPPAPPDDPTPSSSLFQGPGNLNEKKPKPCPKGKVRRNNNGKTRCVAKHKKGQSKKSQGRQKGRAGR